MLGHESIGIVLECGGKVRHFKAGDRVTNVGVSPRPELGLYSFGGGYAEYGLVFDHEAMRADGLSDQDMLRYTVGPRVPSGIIPEDIPDTVAPMLITWRETHSYISRMGLKAGLRVLIIGFRRQRVVLCRPTPKPRRLRRLSPLAAPAAPARPVRAAPITISIIRMRPWRKSCGPLREPDLT